MLSYSSLTQSQTPIGIYAITDAHLMPDDETLFKRVEAALEAGISILQYRDKSADPHLRLRQAKALSQLCDDYGIPLIINDDLDLAEQLGVGVHLGLEDGSITEARTRLGDQAIIGATCHGDLCLAKQAKSEGASYLAFGRFFASRTKPEAIPASLSLLKEAKQFELPIVAIGGIDDTNAFQVFQAGADYLAVVHAIFATDETSRAVARLKQAVNGS